MNIGAVLRNETTLTPQDISLYKLARFDGASVFHYQDPASLVAAGINPSCSVVRLPDSCLPDRIKGHQEYSDECLGVINAFLPHGFTTFILDNEPNASWPAHLRADFTPFGAGDWAAFMDDVLTSLLPSLPPQVMLCMTPFVHPTLSTAWYEDAERHNIVARLPLIAAHCYWQAEGDMGAAWAGKQYEWLHQRTGKRIVITECGNSKQDETPPPNPPALEALQAAQYPKYIEQVALSSDYVQGLYFFILGHNGNWAGFDLTEPICASLGQRTIPSTSPSPTPTPPTPLPTPVAVSATGSGGGSKGPAAE